MVLSWGEKSTNFYWLGELQTTPRKTLTSVVKPTFYLLALALLALALAPRTNGEKITYSNTKENMGAVE